MMAVRRGYVRGSLPYALAFVLLLALFLLVTLPAYFAGTIVSRASHGALSLERAEGTIWHGRAELRASTRGAVQALCEIRWQVRPLWLLAGRLRVELQAQGNGPAGDVVLDAGPTRIVVQDVVLAFPATLIGQFYAPAAFVEPQGIVRLNSPRLEFAQSSLTGNATVAWENAGTRAFNLSQIGDYRLEIKSNGAQTALTLTTMRGDLKVDGEGNLALGPNGASLHLQGFASANPARGDLGSLLNLLGPPGPDGRRAFQFSYPRPQ